MKKILVPTDFSENALNALKYAIQIANQFGSTIMLLNTYSIHSTTGSFISVRRFIEEDIEKSMQELIDLVRDDLRNGASIKYESLEGNAVTMIAKVGKHYDLIIMGTQGATGMIDTFVGSTASGVIRAASSPVLIVPKIAVYQEIKEVVFAVDNLDIALLPAVRVFMELVRTFKAHLHIFHLEEGADDHGIDPLAHDLFDQLAWSFNYEVGEEELNQSINNFVEDKAADLLCMIRRKRGFWENLFHVSATKKEVFSSNIPILILQES